MLKDLTILAQPDDVTCGPTSLHAVYSFFGENVDLTDLIKEIEMLEGGGTLAVYLGIHAMELGYKATVYSYNLRVFDPSWFSFNSEQLIEKLKKQLEYKDGKKFTKTCNAYLEFLEKGGVAIFVLILTGGVLYSAGGIIYALKKPNFSINWFGFHELFHAMTAAAFICHFIAGALTVFLKG